MPEQTPTPQGGNNAAAVKAFIRERSQRVAEQKIRERQEARARGGGGSTSRRDPNIVVRPVESAEKPTAPTPPAQASTSGGGGINRSPPPALERFNPYAAPGGRSVRGGVVTPSGQFLPESAVGDTTSIRSIQQAEASRRSLPGGGGRITTRTTVTRPAATTTTLTTTPSGQKARKRAMLEQQIRRGANPFNLLPAGGGVALRAGGRAGAPAARFLGRELVAPGIEVAGRGIRTAGSAIGSGARGAGRFLGLTGKGVVKATAAGIATEVTTEQIGVVTRGAEERAVREKANINKAVKVGFKARQEAAKERGFFSTVAEQIPFLGPRGPFEKAAREELKAQGLKGEDLELAVGAAIRQSSFSQGGETAGLVSGSAVAENIGRKGIAAAFGKAGEQGLRVARKKGGGRIARLTILPLIRAGAAEGASQEATQQLARQRDFKPGQIGIGAGLGAVSAPVIGAPIAGLSLNRPASSRTLDIIASVADPFEKPGEAAEAVTRKGVAALRGVPEPAIPVVTISGKSIGFGTNTPAQIKTQQKSATQKQKRPSGGGRRRSPGTMAPVNVPSLENIVGSVGTPTPSDTFIPGPNVPVKPDTDIPTLQPTADIITNNETETNTNITASTPTIIPTTASIPVSSPFLRIPPPVPFGFDARGAGKGVKAGKRTVFGNELAAGRQAFRQLVGDFSAPTFPQVEKPKSKKKGKSKKSKKGKKRQAPIFPGSTFEQNFRLPRLF